jgi:hypothetical protein
LIFSSISGRLTIFERTDDLTVELPVQAVGSPVEGVGVECTLRIGDVEELTAVIVPCDSLPEVIVLSLSSFPRTVAEVVAAELEI